MHGRHHFCARFSRYRTNGRSQNGVNTDGKVSGQHGRADPRACEQAGPAWCQGAARAGEAAGAARAGVVAARVARRARLARAARLRHHRRGLARGARGALRDDTQEKKISQVAEKTSQINYILPRLVFVTSQPCVANGTVRER